MRIRYGTYSHEIGEADLSVSRELEENVSGVAYAIRETWTLQGQLQGTSQSNMQAKCVALEAAYAEDGKDIALLKSNNSPTHLQMLSDDTYGGTKVIGRPTFPTQRFASYNTFLNYQIVVQGLKRVSNAELYDLFTERIITSGGGPRYGMLEPLTGFPIRQLLKRNTIYRVTQQGSAIGRNARPLPPSPLWPNRLVEAPIIERDHPTRHKNITELELEYTAWPISWTYQFASDRRLIGGPNLWT